jgi:thiol-disulfide isomerase/thioredoxin
MKLMVFTYLFISLLCLNSCGKKTLEPEKFTLTGSIRGFDNSTDVSIYYHVLCDDKLERISDSTYIIDDKFYFSGNIKELTPAVLRFKDYLEIDIYLEPTNMELIIDKDMPYAYKLSGTSVEKENIELKKEMQTEEKSFYENGEKINTLLGHLNLADNDPHTIDSISLILDEYLAEHKIIFDKLNEIRLDFVKKHPTYQIAPYLLYLSNFSINRDSIVHTYSDLPESTKSTLLGRLILEQIKGIEESERKEDDLTGIIAADFLRKDFQGNIIRLSDCGDKSYVLLDFWASWCLPCLKEIPRMKELHDVYDKKGLKIIGVSLDEDEVMWLNAINKNQIGHWTQVLSLDKEDDIAGKYKIESIPSYILIDKQGQVVARWQHIGNEELFFIDKVVNEK